MNALVALLLKDRISQFTYVDRLAGMVRAVTKERAGASITIPVDIGVDDPWACGDSEITDMVPNDAYKCIVYFEDRGLRRVQNRTRGISFESRLRLVCWVNTAKFSNDNYAADRIMEEFVTDLNTGVYNDGPFMGVRHTTESVPERGKALFSAYTYPDSARQYLLFPFDAFALDIVTTMRIRPGCEDQVTPGSDECWVPPMNRRRRYPSEFTCEELQDPTTGLTASQLGSGCLNCSGGGCNTCTVVNAADPSEVVACIEAENDIPTYLGQIIDSDQATADLIVEAIGNAGKTDAVEALICASCLVTVNISLDGVPQTPIENLDPCENHTININING
jgi:hypothetical protein